MEDTIMTPWGSIPAHWKISTIDQETTVVTDYVANGSFASLAENVEYKSEEDYAVLIRLVDHHNAFSGPFVFIDKDAYDFLSKSSLHGGEVIISNVGANVGEVFRCPSLKYHMSLGPNSIVAKFKGSDDFYYYWLTSKYGQHMLHSIVTGSAQPKFNKTNFREMAIPVPPIEEQQRIASILKSFDDKIDLNNRINHNLEEQAQALYKSWFVDFEPFKDSKFIKSELGMIPEGWSVVSLDSLCSIVSRGFSPKYSDSSKDVVLGQRCVRNNMIDLSVSRTHIPKNLGDRALRQYDVLINSTGMGSLGRVAQIYFKPERMTYDSHLTLVRSKSTALEMYIGRNLLSRQDEIENMAVGSTGQTELPRDSVKAMPIVLPCDSVLVQFGDSIRAITGRIQSNSEENVELCAMRDHLLPKLMSGELIINKIDC